MATSPTGPSERDNKPESDWADALLQSLDQALADAPAHTRELLADLIEQCRLMLRLADRLSSACEGVAEQSLDDALEYLLDVLSNNPGLTPISGSSDALERALMPASMPEDNGSTVLAPERAARWERYQNALRDYQSLFRDLAISTVKGLRQLSGERPPNGLAELYRAWVDCADAAYLDMAATQEYADSYARLINALTAWQAASAEPKR